MCCNLFLDLPILIILFIGDLASALLLRTRVAIRSAVEIESFKAAFAEQHPILNDCWATMDGLKLYLQQAGTGEIKEPFYNGWTHDHYVKSVFYLCPDETISIVFLMFQGWSMTARLQS
jgi:hypothetical protein